MVTQKTAHIWISCNMVFGCQIIAKSLYDDRLILFIESNQLVNTEPSILEPSLSFSFSLSLVRSLRCFFHFGSIMHLADNFTLFVLVHFILILVQNVYDEKFSRDYLDRFDWNCDFINSIWFDLMIFRLFWFLFSFLSSSILLCWFLIIIWSVSSFNTIQVSVVEAEKKTKRKNKITNWPYSWQWEALLFPVLGLRWDVVLFFFCSLILVPFITHMNISHKKTTNTKWNHFCSYFGNTDIYKQKSTQKKQIIFWPLLLLPFFNLFLWSSLFSHFCRFASARNTEKTMR